MRFQFFRLVAVLILSCSALALAQPRTPTVYLNEKVRLVELARGQRATLRFDLRRIRGEHLKVNLYRHDQLEGEEPIKEWLIHKASGRERISFKDLPINVYRMVAYAANEAGEPLAYRAPYIHVEYGGWRAWEKFKPPVETVKEPPPAFDEVDVATNMRNRDAGITLVPRAAIVKPGDEMNFQASFRNMDPEKLDWKLVGDGQLKAIDEMTYTYIAPAEQLGTKLFRIEVSSAAHPNLTGGATILVTNADPETLNR